MRFKNNNNLITLKLILVLFLKYVSTASDEIDLKNPLHREIVRRSKGADIKSWLNTSVEPCENFFKFTCGNWERINRATNYEVYGTDKFLDLSKAMQRKVDELLKKPKNGNVIEDKLRDFYQSCLYTASHDEEYKLDLQKLYRAYGHFSFVEGNTAKAGPEFNWWSTIADIHKTYGKAIILSLDVQGDIRDKNRTMLYIGPTEFNMFSPGKAEKMFLYISEHFGLDEIKASAATDQLLEFEYELTRGATDVQEGKPLEELLRLYNLVDLVETYKDLFDMEAYLRLALNTTQLPEQIYLFDEPYLQNLIKVMNSTDQSVVEDYILWLFLEGFLLDTTTESSSNAKFCGEKTKKYFGKFIDHTIYEQYRSTEYENEVINMWHEIKESFHALLLSGQYSWMSKNVSAEAIEKLQNMKLTINSYGDEDFQGFYKDLNINPHNYVENLQNVFKHSEALRPNKLSKRTASHEDTEVLSFTPVYKSFENSIKIPVSFLQSFYVWHPIYPRAIKYATLGFLLAHEMIHGFDDEGRQYDAQGHIRNWWDDQSAAQFEKKRNCFQQQYHGYIYSGDALPSGMAQAENIADNGGIKVAFAAYSRWLDKSLDLAAKESFPNLSLSNWKLFFISFSQLWCDDIHPDYATMLAMQDTHAPSVYRIIGSLSNFDKFAEIFECKPGTVMNPLEKCTIY